MKCQLTPCNSSYADIQIVRKVSVAGVRVYAILTICENHADGKRA